MIFATGWSNSWHEVRQIRLLEWVVSKRAEEPAFAPLVSTFLETDSGATTTTVTELAAALGSLGFLAPPNRVGGAGHGSLMPTDAGIAEVRRLQATRATRQRRTSAAREAIMDWLYNVDDRPERAEQMLTDARGNFYGEPFAPHELREAMAYLYELRLVSGFDVAERNDPLRPELTALGRQCVENDLGLSEFLRPPAAGIAFYNYGTNYGQQGAGHDVRQRQPVLAPGLRDLVRSLDELAGLLAQEGSDDAHRSLALVTVIRDEVASGDPNEALVRESGSKLERLAAGIGWGALAPAVSTALTLIAEHLHVV